MMEPVLAALVPVGLLVGAGYVLRRSAFLADSFWPQAERIGYYVFLPSLFLHGLSVADISTLPISALAGVLLTTTVIVALFTLACRPLLALDGAAFTSVFQGSIRYNNYVGVTLAAGLFGTQGVAIAALCNAVIVPTVNILCVAVFASFGHARMGFVPLLRAIATNPLILACMGGIALQSFSVHLPLGLESMLKALGAASLPIGLLCVGAALKFDSMRQWTRPVLSASIAKFVVMPAVALTVLRIVPLSMPSALIALLFLALPTASSSYILARQLGGDAPLMAAIIAAETVFAALMIPLIATLPALLGMPLSLTGL